MISCSATAISSSSNFCSGFSPPFAALPCFTGPLTTAAVALFAVLTTGSAVVTTAGAGDLTAAGFPASAALANATFASVTFAGAALAGAALTTLTCALATTALPVAVFVTLAGALDAAFITRAMSPSPFHVFDGAGQLSGFGFQPHHPIRVPAPFGLGQLADYATVHALHVLQPDSLGKFHGHLVVNIRRRRRPRASDQVLLLGGISGQIGFEPRESRALVAIQHTGVNRAIVRIQLLGSDPRSHTIESPRAHGQELDQVAARGQLAGRGPVPRAVRRHARDRLRLGFLQQHVARDPGVPLRRLRVAVA